MEPRYLLELRLQTESWSLAPDKSVIRKSERLVHVSESCFLKIRFLESCLQTHLLKIQNLGSCLRARQKSEFLNFVSERSSWKFKFGALFLNAILENPFFGAWPPRCLQKFSLYLRLWAFRKLDVRDLLRLRKSSDSNSHSTTLQKKSKKVR